MLWILPSLHCILQVRGRQLIPQWGEKKHYFRLILCLHSEKSNKNTKVKKNKASVKFREVTAPWLKSSSVVILVQVNGKLELSQLKMFSLLPPHLYCYSQAFEQLLKSIK